MNISERDILAVLHVTSRKALDARAKLLLERAGNRYWKWWQRWSMLYMCVAMGSVFLFFIYIIYRSFAEKALIENEYSVWVLPIFFIFFANALIRRVMLNQASLKVIRRWPSNPFIAITVLMRGWPSSKQQRSIIGALEERLRVSGFGMGQIKLILEFIALDPKMLRLALAGTMMFFAPIMSLLFLSIIVEEEPFVSLSIACTSFIGCVMLVATPLVALRRYRAMVRNVLPNIHQRRNCPHCHYDLRGTNTIIENVEEYIHCPECGYKGLIG